MPQVLVDRADITTTKLVETAPQELAAGQALLTVESFALTANNVTYAATGDVLGYWRFYPSDDDGWGIVPVWGAARVIESQTDALAVGDRVYGFLPMADQVVLTPVQDGARGVIDTSPHRAELPAVYNRYARLGAPDPVQDHLRALLQPLLATSYLLFDWLEDNGWFGATQIVIGSASSKTGLGLAMFLAEPEARPYRVVGLTSRDNVDFVSGLEVYDQILTYDATEDLPREPTVYVDMSGHAGVKSALHHHLGAQMVHSAAVGTSHWDKFAPPGDLPGAKPAFFFAPAQIAKRREDWGAGEIEARITAAWKRVAARSGDWLDVTVHDGLDRATEVYRLLARGAARPRDGHIIHPGA